MFTLKHERVNSCTKRFLTLVGQNRVFFGCNFVSCRKVVSYLPLARALLLVAPIYPIFILKKQERERERERERVHSYMKRFIKILWEKCAFFATFCELPIKNNLTPPILVWDPLGRYLVSCPSIENSIFSQILFLAFCKL